MIKDKKLWKKCVNNNQKPVAKTVVNVAREAMKILDKLDKSKAFNASEIIHQANNTLEAHITGYMACYSSNLVVQYHSLGKEFQKSWNKHYDIKKLKYVF